ncbi:hypothetical protein [Sorangium sp. So ce1153]|uniref:hypothetical protein n=1 Tax=Sorangium sp. So ce1153 TaxID=3133333 RepID=UPI003F6082D8
MNIRRGLLLIVAVAVWVLSACNWTVGDCYPREEWEKGEGAGGPVGPPVPVFSSSASGDFGAEPPEGPQGGKKEKIQCNKTEDEDEEESPSDSSETPTASPTSPPDPCQQSGAPQMGCTGTKPIDPRAFNFVTIVAYDGTSVAGGWQEAKANLFFGHNQEGDDACMIHIGMPLRSELWGKITAKKAALISADVANLALEELYKKEGGEDLPPGILCSRFKGKVDFAFKNDYKGLGAQVRNP